jgi:ribosomal protein S21
MSDPKTDKKAVILPDNVPVDYSFERMLKTFLKDVDKRGILREVKARRYYIKPSEVKRLAKKSRRK